MQKCHRYPDYSSYSGSPEMILEMILDRIHGLRSSPAVSQPTDPHQLSGEGSGSSGVGGKKMGFQEVQLGKKVEFQEVQVGKEEKEVGFQ